MHTNSKLGITETKIMIEEGICRKGKNLFPSQKKPISTAKWLKL